MELHYSAYLPLLCFDDNTIYVFLNYLRRCESNPNPEEASKATGLPIGACEEKIHQVLYLNNCIHRKRDSAFHAVRRRKLKGFLD